MACGLTLRVFVLTRLNMHSGRGGGGNSQATFEVLTGYSPLSIVLCPPTLNGVPQSAVAQHPWCQTRFAPRNVHTGKEAHDASPGVSSKVDARRNLEKWSFRASNFLKLQLQCHYSDYTSETEHTLINKLVVIIPITGMLMHSPRRSRACVCERVESRGLRNPKIL